MIFPVTLLTFLAAIAGFLVKIAFSGACLCVKLPLKKRKEEKTDIETTFYERQLQRRNPQQRSDIYLVSSSFFVASSFCHFQLASFSRSSPLSRL